MESVAALAILTGRWYTFQHNVTSKSLCASRQLTSQSPAAVKARLCIEGPYVCLGRYPPRVENYRVEKSRWGGLIYMLRTHVRSQHDAFAPAIPSDHHSEADQRLALHLPL